MTDQTTSSNFRPTNEMATEARRGLAWREEYGRGGTEVGVARARDISNRKNLSEETINRMVSYFARHEVDKQGKGWSSGDEGYPSAGRIAWALWGGDPGRTWAKKKAKQIDKGRSLDMERPYPNEHAARIKDPDQYDDFRREKDAFGDGIDAIYGIKGDESELQAIRFDKTKFDAEEAREWLSDNDYSTIEFEEAMTEKAAVDLQHRSMGMDAEPVDKESRRVRMAISSEEPVERGFGMEVLEHSEEAVDLAFLKSGRAPLLLDHDPEKQIGVIEDVELDGSARRLRATVRFGKGALASEVFEDVADGIRGNVSIGYIINKLDDTRSGTKVAKSWRIMEASIVSIPADVTVGVGRNAEIPQEPEIKPDKIEVNPMSEVDIAAVEAEARKAAQRNAAQIVELGARHNRSDLAQIAIREGKSIEEFRGELLDKIGSERALENHDIGLTKREVERFSMVRAIHALANPTDRRAQEAAKFEFECSEAAAKQYGRAAQGVLLPADVLRNWTRDMSTRALNSSDESNLFTDDYRGGEFIDVLRNASSVMRAGARMLNGLSGDVKIPKKLTAAAAAWIATEGGNAAESEMTVGAVSMTPKTLGAYTDVTRQLLIQSSLDVENLIRDDLTTALALAIDLAALRGNSGSSSGQPDGIKNTNGINTVDFGTAPDLVPTFAQVIEMETKLGEDNALMGNLAYILPASMFGALKSVEKATGTAQFVIEPGGTMNGYPAIVSNQAEAGDLYFGNFADLLVGFFGGLDLTVDPYTNSRSGTVRVVALQSCDVAVRHAVSFCLGNDGGS